MSLISLIGMFLVAIIALLITYGIKEYKKNKEYAYLLVYIFLGLIAIWIFITSILLWSMGPKFILS